MRLAELRSKLQAEPFRPLVVYLSNGRQYAIPHREFAAISPAGRSVVVFFEDGGSDYIDLLHITNVQIAG